MQRIPFSNDSFATGDEIAAALFAFAEALAKRGSSSAVTIPIRETDGSIRQQRLLLGPTSELVSRSEASDFDEVTDVELVAFIRHEAKLLSDVEGRSLDSADLDQGRDWEL